MQKATVPGIIRGDYGALMGLIMPVVGWGMVLVINLFGVLPNGSVPITAEEGDPFFFYLALAMTLLGIPLLVWRVWLIQGTFEKGVLLKGEITAVSIWRGRGSVSYRFQHNGQPQEAKTAVATLRPTARALRSGQPVTLVVDATQPKRAFIQALYV